MQPGYPGSGQDPYGQQQPYNDPYAQPQYPPAQPQPPQYQDPYAQPQPPQYQDPYGQQPTSGGPYPTSGSPYPTSPPGYPSYPVAGYGPPAPPSSTQKNVFGLLALILGIVSIPLGCCYLGILVGGAALVLGILGMKKADQGLANNKGMALAGAICGGVGVLIGVGLFVLGVVLNLVNAPVG